MYILPAHYTIHLNLQLITHLLTIMFTPHHHLTCIYPSLSHTRHTTLITCRGPSAYGPGFLWSPKVVEAREGDSVTWAWQKQNPYSQLQHNVFQTSSSSSQLYDGSGFHSGPPTSSGALQGHFHIPLRDTTPAVSRSFVGSNQRCPFQ